MQDFTNPTAMNSPYSTVPGSYGSPDAANAPKLGPVIPGTAGGLPQKPGLSVASNPLPSALRPEQNTGDQYSMYNNMPKPSVYPASYSLSGNQDQQQPQGMARGGVAQAAQKAQQMGRGQDTMLVHMTPQEVNSLQGLAMATGGSLTINPHTGLPEAGWLGKLLPTLIGAGLTFIPGIGPLAAAGIVGAGQTALTGDLSKGLMAGLGAYGGASLAGALAPAATGTALPSIAGQTVTTAAAPVAETAASNAITPVISNAAAPVASTLPMTPLSLAPAGTGTLASTASSLTTPAVPNFAAGFFDKFGAAASQGLSGAAAKYAPYAAGLGLYANAAEAFTPKYKSPEEEKSTYRGPYRQAPRNVIYPEISPMLSRDSSEFSYFDPVNPYPGVIPAEDSFGFASGGSVEKDYGFASPSATYTPTKTSSMPMGMPFFVGGKRGTPGSDQARAMAMMPPTTSLASVGPAVNAYRAQQMQGIPPQTMPGGKAGTLLGRIMAQKAAADAAKLGYTTQAPAAMQAPARTPIPTPEQYTPAMGAAVAPRVDPFSQYMADTGFSDKLAQAAAGYGKAKGGKIHMDDGAFVVDARTVSELGNGSSNAGIDILSRLGGKPVRGPGDGVSDSVPAKIGGKQEARVARDEVIFSADAVKRLGGAKKLYALMDKAHKARKKAGRGSDTKVAKGLGAL